MTILPFGSRVVPSLEQLVNIDVANFAQIEALRPARRSSNVGAHVDFHNAVTQALAFRLMLRFALRAAKQLPLMASIDEQLDTTVDFAEKATHGRRGGLAAILTASAKSELKAYRLHCTALHRKLSKLLFRGTALQWLSDVINHKRVPLLAIIEDRGVPQYLSTQMVLQQTSEIARVADDFGRKWTENSMRLKGCRTSDTDRAMRHEVEDQKANDTVADTSEPNWISRVGHVIDQINAQVFKADFSGLRSS